MSHPMMNLLVSLLAKASPFSFSFGGFGSTNPGTGTTLTVASLAIGAAPTLPDKRYVYAAIGVANSAAFTVTGVTIGGVTASLFAGLNTSAAEQAQIWVAEVPTGTTASVVVTTSANVLCMGAAVYRAINPASPFTPDDNVTSTATTATVTLSLNIQAGGVAIGLVQVRDNASGSAGTWVGLTEDTDADIRSNEWFTSASLGSPGTPTTVSLTRSVAPTASHAVSASLH